MGSWLTGKEVRLRRGSRRDLEAIARLLDPSALAERGRRFDRRLVADLGHDVYVAESREGELVGVVALAYFRSLTAGRFVAILDTLRVAGDRPTALAGLLDLAERRARSRGCRDLLAMPGAMAGAVGAMLRERGWTERTLLGGEPEEPT